MNSLSLWLVRIFDAVIGKTAASILSVLKKPDSHPSAVNNLAVIRLWAIGESILALPAISAIKEAQPGATITLITTPYVAPIFYKQAAVDSILVVKPNPLSLLLFILKNWRKFEIAVDFEPFLFTSSFLAWSVGKWQIGFATRGRQKLYSESIIYNDKQHVVRTNLDLVKTIGAIEQNPCLPLLTFSNDDKIVVDKIMTDLEIGSDALILIAPGVGGSALYRMWPWKRFAKLADQLVVNNKCQVVWLGQEEDEMLINRIQEAMKNGSKSVTRVTLNQLFCLVSQAQLIIANDSGVMHIGAAMKVPTLGLFGPNTPVRFGPFGEGNRSLYHPAEGNPCINVHKGEIPVENKHCGKLMLSIKADEVCEAAEQMLSSRRQAS